jgi:hypothetical protein
MGIDKLNSNLSKKTGNSYPAISLYIEYRRNDKSNLGSTNLILLEAAK